MAAKNPGPRSARAAKAGWVRWLKDYGIGKFYDAFIEIAQGAESECVYCGEWIYLDIVEGGGVPDWGTALEGSGLDYGCPNSPDTNSEGTGGHKPKQRSKGG